MGLSFSAASYLRTTGTAIAIGTNIQLFSLLRCSDLAGTLSIYAGANLLITMSADRMINFTTPIAIQGPVAMTSSAGQAFMVGYRLSNP